MCHNQEELLSNLNTLISLRKNGNGLIVREVHRKTFNETRGRELVATLTPETRPDSPMFQKYVALSCANAINCYLEETTGDSILTRALTAENKCVKYLFNNKNLNLDAATCLSLNLFGNQNSLISLFKPSTSMGKKQLRRRINQPSACVVKINKWQDQLKQVLELNGGMAEANLKSTLGCLNSLDTNLNQIILILKQRSYLNS